MTRLHVLEPIAVVLVGLPASGKTKASYMLEREAGFARVRPSDVLRAELRRRGLTDGYNELEQLARDVRTEFGDSVIADWTIAGVREKGLRRITIDGPRSLGELAAFRAAWPRLRVVAIHSSPTLRLLRSLRVPPPITEEQFHLRDESNLRFGLGDLIALADAVVPHEHESLDMFCRDVLATVGQVVGLDLPKTHKA